MFVPESSGMHQFVHDDTGRPACDATVVETHFLHSAIQKADVTPATYFQVEQIYPQFSPLKSIESTWQYNFLQIPSSTLVDPDVVRFGGSWDEADASFRVVCIHGKGNNISLVLCYN